MAALQSRHFESQITGPPDPTSSGHKRKILETAPSVYSSSEQGSQFSPEYDVGQDPNGESDEIPEAKRRAQNRAAQRAFRERKEKHLKDLENRLAELENESRSWKSTNMALRNKLSLLETELQHYRWSDPKTEQQAQFGTPTIDLQVPNQMTPHLAPQVPPQMQSQMPNHQQMPMQQQHGLAPSQHTSPGPVPSLDSSSTGTPSRADDFCAKLSTACVVNNKKVADDAPYISADHPGWQKDALYSNSVEDWLNNSINKKDIGKANDLFNDLAMQTSHPQVNPNYDYNKPEQNTFTDPINLDFGNMATGFGGFKGEGQDPDFMGLLNNDFGVFDPLDGLLEWNPSEKTQSQPEQKQQNQSQPQASQAGQQQAGQQGGDTQAFSPNMPSGNSPLFSPQPGDSLPGLSGAYDNNIPNKADEHIPSASQKFIQCADVWDRICSHPRFGEIDINSMCQELRNKARCSKTGVVLDEQDVNAVLGTMR